MADTLLQIEVNYDIAVGTPKLYLYDREGHTAVGNVSGYTVAATLGTFLREYTIPEADGVDAEIVYGEVRDDEKVLAFGWALATAGERKLLAAVISSDIASEVVYVQNDANVTMTLTVPGQTTAYANTTNNSIYIGEQDLTVEFTAVDENGDSYDLSALPLVIIFEDTDKVDIATVADEDITKSGNVATITLPNILTASVQTVNWAIRHETSKKVYGKGSLSISYAPEQDA